MDKRHSLILLFITCRIFYGQNLVQNGNFENYSSCPGGVDQLNKAFFWRSANDGTPEYFNQCSFSSAVSVPKNTEGYQQAHSGAGYGGGYFYYPGIPNYRQFMQVSLASPLIAGETYHFEMYLNAANITKYTISNMGVYFSNTMISGITNYYPLPFTPQLSNFTGFITDTLAWTLVGSNYVAAGGESYLTIGNFTQHDSLTNFQILNTNWVDPAAYFYVDDVSLTNIVTSMDELNSQLDINPYPNPTNDKLNFKTEKGEVLQVTIFDLTSRKLFQQKFSTSISIDTERLAKGIYLYEVIDSNGLFKKGKFVKE